MQFLKKNKLILYVSCMVMIFLIGCANVNSVSNEVVENIYDEHTKDTYYSVTRNDGIIKPEEATIVDIKDVGQDLIIDIGGDYLLKGGYDGQIIVDAEEEIVHLYLDGVSIRSSNGCAIWAKNAAKLIITSMDGTENTIIDDIVYQDDDVNACIYSESDITINGSGSLTVTGIYEDAIHSKDVLKVINTNLKVLSKGDGIRGNDGVYILDSQVDVQSEENGIRTTKTGKGHKGSVVISNSQTSVIAGQYGIISAENLVIDGGYARVKSVISDYSVAGDVIIGEECYIHE